MTISLEKKRLRLDQSIEARDQRYIEIIRPFLEMHKFNTPIIENPDEDVMFQHIYWGLVIAATTDANRAYADEWHQQSNMPKGSNSYFLLEAIPLDSGGSFLITNECPLTNDQITEFSTKGKGTSLITAHKDIAVYRDVGGSNVPIFTNFAYKHPNST